MSAVRTCSQCREQFPDTREYFGNRSARCKPCARAYYRAWYVAHREYAKAVMRAKYKPHGDPAPWRSSRDKRAA